MYLAVKQRVYCSILRLPFKIESNWTIYNASDEKCFDLVEVLVYTDDIPPASDPGHLKRNIRYFRECNVDIINEEL
ncbi:hypothetical protein TNCV_2930691 [Trichonephila clavipes]|nr:hypothetical protein TNCV_2930691 [Trichonephila clavipes]